MKRLLIGLALLAAPVAAQTGTCVEETGTSTAWEIVESSPESVRIRYDFYAAGLTGQTHLTRNSSVAAGTNLIAFANSQCESLDESRTADELLAARELVFQNPDAELVQPAYPEACADTPPEPANPTLTPIQICRLATFHRDLVLESWPEDALFMLDYFQEVYNWLDDNAPQGGAGFNTVELRNWLAITNGQRAVVNSRMNNLRAISSAIGQDKQWQGDLGGF